MKKRFINMFYGKSSMGNGLIAMMIISLIVLGCTCNQKDGFNFGKNDSTVNRKSIEHLIVRYKKAHLELLTFNILSEEKTVNKYGTFTACW